jgi:hypothetical protein
LATEIINKNGGRPKGSSNKTTLEIRTAWTDFVLLNFKDAQTIYDGLNERDKMGVLKGISEMVLPKRAAIEIEDTPPETTEDYDRLTFDEHMQLIGLIEKLNGVEPETQFQIEYKTTKNDKRPF